MKSSIMLGVVLLAIVFFSVVSLPLGIIAVNEINKLKKELTYSQRLTEQAEQRLIAKEQQIAQLSGELQKLSESLKTAKTQETMNYELRGGDTLYGLFGTDWPKIAKLNKIECVNNIQAGKTINFPGYIYYVKKGDSFFKLFGKNWKRIAYLNGFCPQQAEILLVGQCLKVPNI